LSALVEGPMVPIELFFH